MSRTEHDLVTMYNHQPSADALDRQIVDWITDPGKAADDVGRSAAHAWAGAAATSVAVAAVAVTITAVVSSGHPDRSANLQQPAASTPQQPATGPSTTVPPAENPGVPLTAQVAQQTLLDLLPRTGIVTARAGAADLGQALTELTFDDGHGAAAIDLAVTYPTNSNPTPESVCAPLGGGPVPTGCRTLPDGTQLFQSQGYEFPDHRVNTLSWSVTVVRPDGLQVEISEWNAPTEKDTPISRPAPPFTMAELTAVAVSPAWTSTISASTANRDASLFVPDYRLGTPTNGPSRPSGATAARDSAGSDTTTH